MDSLDQQVLQQLRDWLAAGQTAWLCTVAGVTGSAPRPVGSLFGCSATGVAGSLSGGCVEEELLERLRSGHLDTGRPLFLEYGVTAEENERLGLPCGGRLQVLVERWLPDAEALAQLDALLTLLRARRVVRRRLDLHSGAWLIAPVEAYMAPQRDAEYWQQCYGPRFQMLLIGAGEVARCLAQMAQMLDYRVLVCDPRAELRQQWPLPGVELIAAMPDDAVREYCRDRHSIVITLTHDPRIDDMALMEALRTDLFYVGALGSLRTSRKRRERLLQLDLTPAQIERLHAPVGLNIGSKRPPEIAIAILAQLTQLRAAAVEKTDA